ncbi:MAG: hypothetical protein R6V46_13725, partial [Desulfatiglandaceae bacterium]
HGDSLVIHLGQTHLIGCLIQLYCFVHTVTGLAGHSQVGVPAVVIAIGQEGVDRRKYLFDHLDNDTLILQNQGIHIPPTHAEVHRLDFKNQGIKSQDWALASLSVLAKLNKVISLEMLQAALKMRFKDRVLSSALDLVEKMEVG